MSYSTMKTGIREMADVLVRERAALTKVKQNGQSTSAVLAAIPETFAAVLAEVNAIPANTTNPAESLLKAELAKMVTEYTALKQIADSVGAITV